MAVTKRCNTKAARDLKILLLGPLEEKGSVSPYVRGLASEWQHIGCEVTTVGSTSLPVDINGQFWTVDDVLESANDLLRTINFANFDVVSLHFGKLELEQVFPLLLLQRKRLPPVVYHVHSVGWALFSQHINALNLATEVEQAIRQLDGYVFFGEFGQRSLFPGPNAQCPASIVCFYPDALPKATGEHSPDVKFFQTPHFRASLFGFNSPWKDILSLFEAFSLMSVPMEFVLAGKWWRDDIKFTEEQVGSVTVRLFDQYISGLQARDLVQSSQLGLFPYIGHHSFQGSGVAANYLSQGVPCVAFDVANMREVVGKAGALVATGDVARLSSLIEATVVKPELYQRMRDEASRRSSLFDMRHHASKCLEFYWTLL